MNNFPNMPHVSGSRSQFALLIRTPAWMRTEWRDGWLTGRLASDLQPRSANPQLGGVIIAGSILSESNPWMMQVTSLKGFSAPIE